MTEILFRNDNYTFQQEGSIVSASWSNNLSADSQEFLNSVQLLVNILAEKKITGLFLTSGLLSGGTFTEETIRILDTASPKLKLEKIALLESSDFLWDNNVIHLLNYIKQVANLKTRIQTFATREEGFKWLKEI